MYLEQIILKGNKCLNTTEVEHINDECRKNQLIKKHILQDLPRAKDNEYVREAVIPKTCCHKYDVRKLVLKDVSFYSSDFIAKFCHIHKRELHTLKLINVHTEQQLSSLMIYLRDAKHQIATLHIENCTIHEQYLAQFLNMLKTNKTIKSLSFVNMMNMQKFLKRLFRCLKRNTTLEHLCLKENEIDNYDYINKLIRKNHFIHKIDVRENYMNEEILESLWDSLHFNIELTELSFDSQDNELDQIAI